MRQVVMFDDVRELEIWPSKLFDKYLEITEKEVKKLLVSQGKLVEVSCPACNNSRKKKAFKKYGLEYVECNNCHTLYVSPRPQEEDINRYFNESEAVEFWYNSIVKKTLKNRIEHQSRPRATWIANLTEEYFRKPQIFVTISPSSLGFLEEIDSLNLFDKKIILNPHSSISQTYSGKKGFEILDDYPLKKYYEINANVVSAFGYIDRVFNPVEFLKHAKSILSENGLLFVTTSTISGFDLQVLWQNAKSIFPPDRINLFSIEGISQLLENNGFEIIELSTPGQLDVELVKNAVEKNNELELPRFVSYLLNNRDEDAHRSFQQFLQQFKLSSHVRIAAKKR